MTAIPADEGNTYDDDAPAKDAGSPEDRKAVEARLRESEARFAKFMQNLPGLAWIKDSDGRYIYANEAATKAFRTPLDILYGKTDFDVFDEELARTFVRNDRDALDKGNLQTVEVLDDENGVSRYSIVNKFAIPIEEADPLIGGIAIDITEQKRAQEDHEFLFSISEAIRVNREPNQLMAEISGTLGKYLDVHRCLFNEIDIANDIEIVRSDYSRTGESVAGRHKVSDYSPIASANMESGQTVVNRDSKTDPRTAEFYEKTYAPSKELAYMTVPMLRGGKWVASLWCSDDKPRDWTIREIALVENIAERAWSAVERLRTEEALREKEAELETIIYGSPFMLTRCGRDLQYKYVSPAFAEMVGLSFSEIAGRPIVEVLGEQGYETIRPHVERVLRGETVQYETRLELPNTESRDITVVYSPERTETGEVIGWIGSIVDITERKRAEEELRESRERLRRAHDELEVRVHDRTRALADVNEALRKEIAERERNEAVKIGLLQRIVSAQETERQRIARDIHDQLGQRLTALRLKLAALRLVCGNENGEIARVEHLQEIAHLLDSEISFLASELRPNTLDDLGLEAALRAHASDWSRHYDVKLEFHSNSQIGRSLGRDTEIQLYRIAQEALHNVAKHARATQVDLLLKQTAETLVLIIEDNGVGFDEKASKTRQSGRGMGLVGMNERASLIGAGIEIESEKGAGTTIFVRLPMNNQAEEA